MCQELYKYCDKSTSELVEKMAESTKGDWKAMTKALSELFNQSIQQKQYTRTRLESFVNLKREILTQNDFADYNQEF